ncbi:hypothetical protein DH2020_047514 [Rehmannia glutinosa]|uniref:DUF4283 domain-containing protein n=1 Tax=Rehmannia glutinosa TaxID=99300 RepID=A0ABR0U882_REHGL
MPDSGRISPENSSSKPTSFAQVAGASNSNPLNLAFDAKKVLPVGTPIVKDGKKILKFSNLDTDRLDSAWNHTLIGKFSFAIPTPSSINKGFVALDLRGTFKWSFSTPSHIIMKFDLEEDYQKIWLGMIWSFGDCPMRVFKWTPEFNPREEVPIAPVWIRLPGLPIQFCDYHALYAMCKEVGNPLQVDSPTASNNRLSYARKIVFERVPSYCSFCKHIGHGVEECYMNGNKSKPPPPVHRPQGRHAPSKEDLRTPAHPMEDMGLQQAHLNVSILDTRPKSNPNSNQQGCMEVKRKSHKVTRFLPKSVIKGDIKSTHVYFNEVYDKAADGSSNLNALEMDNDSNLNNISNKFDGLANLEEDVIKGSDREGCGNNQESKSSPKKLELVTTNAQLDAIQFGKDFNSKIKKNEGFQRGQLDDRREREMKGVKLYSDEGSDGTYLGDDDLLANDLEYLKCGKRNLLSNYSRKFSKKLHGKDADFRRIHGSNQQHKSWADFSDDASQIEGETDDDFQLEDGEILGDSIC